MRIFIAFLFLALLTLPSSCKPKKDLTTNNPQKTLATDKPQNEIVIKEAMKASQCRYLIEFYSIGTGSDMETFKILEDYLKNNSTDKDYIIKDWGMEDEKWVCLIDDAD